MTEELRLRDEPDVARAFALTYGGTVNGQYLNWEPGAGKDSDAWQILSPTRSRSFGVTELNRHIKRTYRADDLLFAQQHRRSNIPKPIGPELIVRGDKVMLTRSDSRRWRVGNESGYVANGEIELRSDV